MSLVLATVAQLRNRLQDQNLDATVAQQAIDDASSLVRAASGQILDFVAGETVVLAGGGRELALPQRPVVVDSGHPLTVVELPDVGAAGVTVVDGTHFRRVGDRLVKAWRSRYTSSGPFGTMDVTVLPPGLWAPWVQVTYSHGYTTTCPAELTAVVLDAAATYASNPAGLRSLALDGETTLTWASETITAPTTLVDDIRRKLRGIGVRRGAAFSIRTG
jgi:hypothetical protein